MINAPITEHRESQGQLFDVNLIDPGRLMLDLPENVRSRARQAARYALFAMPRYSRDIGPPEEMRDIAFLPDQNAWHESIGAMGITVTAEDIALNGARAYMSDVVGAGYFRFDEELKPIAADVAEEYKEYHG